ncbi:hypothetical protein BO99DRAFT_403929 [Aspergillus violaceofuscus CBS 115571]|uniref:Uncharacterized protein n=1 Tax=Aspergillus violaceofuscus (strain CBS 115571) TaxID=1450538 RepID=A0A2V5H288_ASPV1|nr:hypothetical protein BO99DRAFT_403929 [Aspergillus violaceofuscus CBS 115571]
MYLATWLAYGNDDVGSGSSISPAFLVAQSSIAFFSSMGIVEFRGRQLIGQADG